MAKTERDPEVIRSGATGRSVLTCRGPLGPIERHEGACKTDAAVLIHLARDEEFEVGAARGAPLCGSQWHMSKSALACLDHAPGHKCDQVSDWIPTMADEP